MMMLLAMIVSVMMTMRMKKTVMLLDSCPDSINLGLRDIDLPLFFILGNNQIKAGEHQLQHVKNNLEKVKKIENLEDIVFDLLKKNK
jgi:hypothetical protein